jgi:quinol monooxygenase YgiN
MIFVAGTMTFNPDLIREFEADVAAMVDKVRAEDGCHHYSLLVEDAGAGLINVMEIWENDEALAVHFTQPWIATFFAKYGGKMQASTVQVYDISGVRPLPM